jgi:hypothetical protein
MYGLLIHNRFLHDSPAITQGNAKKNSCSFIFFLHSKQKKKNKKQNKAMTRTRPKAIKETTGITNDALLELRHGVIMPRNKTNGAQR